MMLVEDTDLDFSIYDSVAVEDVQLSYEGVQKSRFSGAIGAYEGNSGVHINFQVDLADDDICSIITDFTISNSENWSVELWRCWEFENNGRFYEDFCLHVFLDFLDDLTAGLDKFGSFSIGSELIDERLVMGNLLKLILSLLNSVFSLLTLSFLVGVEVTLVVGELFVFEFDYFVNNSVKEVPSMGDDDDGDVEGDNVLLEPDESDQIQVISRLIEHEDFWLAEDNLSDGDSHSPTSREFVGRPVKLLFSETETFKNDGGLGWGVFGID